ncbi:transposable element Tc3 transposase [Trichonephila clavipes]|nr:transposable element Tc3 transposase [Trichonephila clavipes]
MVSIHSEIAFDYVFLKIFPRESMELGFQQDGGTCHTARATIDLLKDTFGDHLISRFRPVNWPPRSCDLTPLDYFLWGYAKSLVYADKPQTLDHLEDNIRRVISDIRPQMLENVIENWTSRLDYIRASRGSHYLSSISKLYKSLKIPVFDIPVYRYCNPHWIFSPKESNSSTPISVGNAVVEMDIHQLGFV